VREIRFVNRFSEINALGQWASEFRALPLYIYGPEGCGKTRLFKEFIKRFDEFFGEDAVAIYIDAMERESIDKAILTSKTAQLAKEILISLIERFSGFKIGEILANNIATILEKAVIKKKYENNHVLVVIDDVSRAIGVDKIEWYIKWLYELMWKISEEYKPKAVNFIATTSEGISRRLVARHRHATIYLIWNLDKSGFEELFHELNPPSYMNFNDVWSLFGGNPSKLIELAWLWRWDIDTMIKYYRDILRELVIELMRKDLVKELELILEDIDNLSKISSHKIDLLEQILVERNLVIYKNWMTIDHSYVSSDKEIGVGEFYAWQTPLFRDLLKQILRSQ